MLTRQTTKRKRHLSVYTGMSALEATAAQGIEQCHLVLLYRSLVPCGIDYGFGLTTLMSQTKTVYSRQQKKGGRESQTGNRHTHPLGPCRSRLISRPPFHGRQKVEQVKESPHSPLIESVKTRLTDSCYLTPSHQRRLYQVMSGRSSSHQIITNGQVYLSSGFGGDAEDDNTFPVHILVR